ncbi:hypothetical protein NC651_000368 [Populus alba x Populus x berolinensis]|nr:hypothetical protein NC651_000368 [Populus alba x Populus x berolinensis]
MNGRGSNHHMTSLQELNRRDCSCLMAFLEGGLPTNRVSFQIENFDHLRSFPEGGLRRNLKSLRIANCENLIRCIEMESDRLTSPRNFSIRGCRSVVSFPGDWMLPTALTSLCIHVIPDLRT